MKKWRVKFEETLFFDDNDELQCDYRWCVTSPSGVSWGSYPTWEEAMRKADKESRTRTVVLPADPRHAGRFSLRVKHHSYGPVVKIESTKSTQNLTIVKDEAEALALALLTHGKPRRAR